jgi:hypothetical protein
LAKIEWLCHEALARPIEARTAFLIEACRDDDRLLHEVESLLARNGETSFLSAPAVMTSAASTLVGQRLGPYVISARIGEGGMKSTARTTQRLDAMWRSKFCRRFMGQTPSAWRAFNEKLGYSPP